jgi:hypothetical protein
LILICFGIKAIASEPDYCYVKTADKTYFGLDLKIGLVHTRIVQPDGTFAKVNNRDVIAYKHHDQLFMLMPVICDKSDTLCMAMMEFVGTKKDCAIFRYCCKSKDDDRLSDAMTNHFFVYKNGKFIRRIDEDQTEALKTYGIKLI